MIVYLTDNKSTLVQMMAWYRQTLMASMLTQIYDVTKPQWVNSDHDMYISIYNHIIIHVLISMAVQLTTIVDRTWMSNYLP